MKIAYYQGHFPVGAIEANAEKIVAKSFEAKAQGVDLIFFPELTLSGYPTQDLLLQKEFRDGITQVSKALIHELPEGIAVGFGTPIYRNDKIYNSLVVAERDKVLLEYHKQALPNYGVFDEYRYFTPGNVAGIFNYRGKYIGLLICEDMWHEASMHQLQHRPLDLVVSINASPFERGKIAERIKIAQNAQAVLKAPVLYVHQIGVQDEIIFDGASFYLDKDSKISIAPQFDEFFFVVPMDVKTQESASGILDSHLCGNDSNMKELYQALCFALKGYVEHHKFPGVLVGLSGGVDSALTLAIAVDALGKDRVQAVLMPSRYTADMSNEDAVLEAKALGVDYEVISIEALFGTFLAEISPHFIKQEWDITEENIQARLRGMILMALSNKSGRMVVSTTNKSELAVGYGTLYGDMCGGFALLKDVYKTEVYTLVRYRNTQGMVIPDRVITRAPSAELRENQRDQDSLPDYDILDQIIKLYVEENDSAEIIKVKLQLEKSNEVDRVIKMINRSEYKRFQSSVGPKVSRRAFGRDWRMPIMHV